MKRKADQVSVSRVTASDHVIEIGGEKLHAFGIGTLPLGVCYPSDRPSEREAEGIIHAAIDAGCQFFDTADTYGRDGKDCHYVERLLGRALLSFPDRSKADAVRIATKGSMVRINSQSNGWRCGNVSPDRVKSLIRGSYEALNAARVEAGLEKQPIFLWQLHHVDSSGKTAAQVCQMTVEAMKAANELVAEGLVSNLGLCNATVAQLRAVLDAGVPLVSLQNLFSPFRGSLAASKPLPPVGGRKPGKASLLGTLAFAFEEGLCFIPHGALGGINARRDSAKPWPQPLIEAAARHGVSVQALALALMRRAHPNLLLISGSRSKKHAQDSVATPPKIAVSDSEFNELVNWI